MNIRLSDASLNSEAIEALESGYEPAVFHNNPETIAMLIKQSQDDKPWVIFDGETPVGFFIIRSDFHHAETVVTTIYLTPSYRGRGINQTLQGITLLAGRLLRVSVAAYVMKSNEPSVRSLKLTWPNAILSETETAIRFDSTMEPTPDLEPADIEMLNIIFERIRGMNLEV